MHTLIIFPITNSSLFLMMVIADHTYLTHCKTPNQVMANLLATF